MSKLFSDFQNKMAQQGFSLILEKKVNNYKFDEEILEAYCLYYHPSKHILVVADSYSYGERSVVNSAHAYMCYAFNRVYSSSDNLRVNPSLLDGSSGYKRQANGQWAECLSISLNNQKFDFNDKAWQEIGEFTNWTGKDFSHTIFLRPEFFTDKDTHTNLGDITKINVHTEDCPGFEDRKIEARTNHLNKNFIKTTLSKALIDWESFYISLPVDLQNKFNVISSNHWQHSHHDIDSAIKKTNQLYPYTAQEISIKHRHLKSAPNLGRTKKIVLMKEHLEDYCARALGASQESFSVKDKEIWSNINHNLSVTMQAAKLNLNYKKTASFLDTRLQGDLFQGLEHKKFDFINFFLSLAFIPTQKNICNYYFKKAVKENEKNGFFNDLISKKLYKEHTGYTTQQENQTPVPPLTILEDMCFGPKSLIFSKQSISKYLANYFAPQLNSYFLGGGSFELEKIKEVYNKSMQGRINQYLKSILIFDKYKINWWGSSNELDKLKAYKIILDKCQKYKDDISKDGYLAQIEAAIIIGEKEILMQQINIKLSDFVELAKVQKI